jgi:hypothetical protein
MRDGANAGDGAADATIAGGSGGAGGGGGSMAAGGNGGVGTGGSGGVGTGGSGGMATGSGGVGTGGSGGMATGGGGGSNPQPVPEVHWKPTGARTTWENTSFIMPPGLMGAAATDRFEMSALGEATGKGQCAIEILRPMAASGDLATQAESLLKEYFVPQGVLLRDPEYGTNFAAFRVYWVSPKGWDFVEITAEVRGPDDMPSDARGRIVLVGLGTKVVPIFAFTPSSKGCLSLKRDAFQDLNNFTWQWLYYSLEFSGATRPPFDLTQKVIGKWSTFAGGGGQGALVAEIYAANGRYATDATLGTWREVSATEIGLFTTTFTGSGRYAVAGDTLARFPDRGAADASLFRVVERHDMDSSGADKTVTQLAQMLVNVLSDGTRLPFELFLGREPQ